MNKLAIVLVGAAVVAPAAWANLVENGDFSNGFFTYSVGGQGLPGWKVLGNATDDNVAIFTPDPPRGFATNHMDLSGFSDKAGVGIEQGVSTTAGQSYRLYFDYWTGDYDVPAVLEAFLDGVSIGTFSTGPNSITPSSYINDFVAAGDTTTLKFLTTDDGAIVDIDNVKIESVPEPITMISLGIGLLAVARRRQK